MLLPGGIPDGRLLFCMSPGSIVFTGYEDAPKIISFVYENMDNSYRVQWADMTGREQTEWICRWEACNRDYERQEHMTRGLCGTNIDALNTMDLVVSGMQNAPSLYRRRPTNHPLTQEQWEDAARRSGMPPPVFM